MATILEGIETLDAVFSEMAEGAQESTIHRISIAPQVYEDQGVAITLTGAEEITEVPVFFPAPPAEGHRFIVFEFDVCNDNNGDFPVSSLTNFIAVMGGREYTVSMSALVALERDITQLDFVVPPGRSMRGLIGFELPAVAGVVEIVYANGSVYTSSDNTEAVPIAPHTFSYER